MSVVYASPNRSHHFPYAEGLEKGGMLSSFVQGYPRWKNAPLAIPHEKIIRRDSFQLLFLPLFRTISNHPLTHRVNLKSKNHIDAGLTKAMQCARVGLFYNGCGLNTVRHWRNKDKIFICEAVNSHLDYQNELLRDECKRIGTDFIESYEPERQKRLAEYTESDYILCPSTFVAQSFIKKGFSEKKLLVNPFGISSTHVESTIKSKSKSSVFRILYVGSINFRKGLRYLIEAFESLTFRDKELWVVGPNLEPTGISDIKIPDGVIFKGVLKGQALSNAYLSADVFVQPSIEEGLSLVIGEALGHGLPVIATHNTGAGEIFEDGECGYHIPIRDSKIISEKLIMLKETPSLQITLSKNAIQKSRQFGGWEKSQKSLCSLIKSIQK